MLTFRAGLNPGNPQLTFFIIILKLYPVIQGYIRISIMQFICLMLGGVHCLRKNLVSFEDQVFLFFRYQDKSFFTGVI